MSDKDDEKTSQGQAQEFLASDLLIETAGEKMLRDIGEYAAEDLERLSKLPPGQARDEQVAEDLETIQKVRDEQERRK